MQIHSVGYAPGTFFVYEQKYDANGKPLEGQFVDRHEDGVINELDKYRTHNPEPKVTMGFSTSLAFDRWTLSTSLPLGSRELYLRQHLGLHGYALLCAQLRSVLPQHDA